MFQKIHNSFQKRMDSSAKEIWLKDEQNSGIVGMLNCLRKEPSGEKFR